MVIFIKEKQKNRVLFGSYRKNIYLCSVKPINRMLWSNYFIMCGNIKCSR